MEQQALKVEARSGTGKNFSRQLRAKGLVPGIVYGRGSESVPVSVNLKELLVAVERGQNALIPLQGNGLDGSTVIISDLPREPLRGMPLHVDLHKVNLSEKVHVHVPVRLVGTAVGVKEGGHLDFVMHAVDVECLPAQIPEHIDVDIAALAIGHSVHLGDITVPAGVKLLGEPKASIVSVLGRAREEAPPAEAE